jgi:hypothetical protein
MMNFHHFYFAKEVSATDLSVPAQEKTREAATSFKGDFP